MLKLVARQFRKAIGVQVALMVLFASSMAIFMIYGAFVARESLAMSLKIEGRIIPGHYLVSTNTPTSKPDLASSRMQTAPFRFMAGWYEANVPSNRGELRAVFLDDSPRVRDILEPGTVLVHNTLAKRLGLRDGDLLIIGSQQYLISALFEGAPGELGYNFGEKVLVFTGLPQHNTSLVFNQANSNATWTLNQLRSMYPGAQIDDVSSEHGIGARLVNNNYSQIKQAQFGLVLFVLVAFLTAKIMNFMDGRKTIAILKAIGLKNVEVAGATSLEAVIAPLCGSIMGTIGGSVILRVLEQRGTSLSLSSSLIINAIPFLLPAGLAGILIPGRFAQVATVNELLFERSISLLRESVGTLSRSYPALEPYVEKGIQFIKLDIIDGRFDGYLFRKPGDAVKQGEVLAVSTRWWGLKSREFVAPIDGTIVYFQKDTGFVGIGPAELLHWQPERRHFTPRVATASQD